eukprot:scaffold16872_cov24-Phaeocystis_antarctica.AAC.1
MTGASRPAVQVVSCACLPASRSRGDRLRSEGCSEAGDRRAMAQDCARSRSGRTGTRTKR